MSFYRWQQRLCFGNREEKMQRRLLPPILFSLLLLMAPLTVHAKDPNGWATATWGMTSKEIKRAFGDRLRSVKGDFRGEAYYVEWKIPETRIDEYPFEVRFIMSKATQRLIRVSLHLVNAEKYPAAYERLLGLLTNKYGKATARNRIENVLLVSDEAKWVLGKTVISATQSSVWGVFLLYESRTAATDPNL